MKYIVTCRHEMDFECVEADLVAFHESGALIFTNGATHEFVAAYATGEWKAVCASLEDEEDDVIEMLARGELRIVEEEDDDD